MKKSRFTESQIVAILKMGEAGVAEAIITDVDGKPYAHATTTCLIFPLP
jgi:acyl-coenzyme A thioesterase PaaI-like protein